MRRWFYGFLVGGLLAQGALASSAAQPAVALEPEPAQWKGKPYENVLQIGFMPGLGLLGSRVGLGLNGAVSVLAARNGFIDDINDQAYVEAMGGPLIVSNTVAWTLNVHLRWDFHKNDLWSFYSLGGFGAEFGGAGVGNYSCLHPRFAIGALWNLFEFLSFRAEISHEFTGVGIVYLL